MKTFVRLIRRYVLLAVGVSLLLLVLGITVLLWVTVRLGTHWQEQFRYSYTEIADNLQRDEAGRFTFPDRATSDWLDGYAWAMVLDDAGRVIWQYQLPEALNKTYTASEIASFSRWYLADYPVFCQVRPYGLLVLGMPKDSVWKYNFWTYPELIEWIFYRGGTVILGVLLAILALCMWFGWRGTRSLQGVSEGLDALAEGRTVQLSTRGFAGELAEKLNQTSRQIQYRNEIIEKRDTARTQWIAGVSHDIRTPLSLILGWSEQLQQDAQVPAGARQKAAGIQGQSEKIKSLVEDLNLTSKLQYGAQPLRCRPVHAGALLRRLVAQFCDEPVAQSCEVAFSASPAVEQAVVQVDEALLARAIENVLGNSVRHNPEPVHCQIQATVEGRWLSVTLTDDGVGYPAAILEAMKGNDTEENAPHILGLHVVEQILRAHGGSVLFGQNSPCGSKTVLRLPIH